MKGRSFRPIIYRHCSELVRTRTDTFRRALIDQRRPLTLRFEHRTGVTYLLMLYLIFPHQLHLLSCLLFRLLLRIIHSSLHRFTLFLDQLLEKCLWSFTHEDRERFGLLVFLLRRLGIVVGTRTNVFPQQFLGRIKSGPFWPPRVRNIVIRVDPLVFSRPQITALRLIHSEPQSSLIDNPLMLFSYAFLGTALLYHMIIVGMFLFKRGVIRSRARTYRLLLMKPLHPRNKHRFVPLPSLRIDRQLMLGLVEFASEGRQFPLQVKFHYFIYPLLLLSLW
jgi:hypothetical protein